MTNTPFDPTAWPTETSLTKYVSGQMLRTMAVYREDPKLVNEHANLERAVAQGSYGHRQIYELVQNGADAMSGERGGRIHVILTQTALYCANHGQAMTEEGVDAILRAFLSVKRGSEIGRFGIGFKSVIGVSKRPEIFSRSGSMGFDAERATKDIRKAVPDAPHYPVLRLGYPIDALKSAADDQILYDLMSWATTVVRLPRRAEDSTWLSDDIRDFPTEFLLFCPHVGSVVLEDRAAKLVRTITLTPEGATFRLGDGKEERLWRVFSCMHRPSPDAKKDAGELADRDELPIIWAVPCEGRPSPGRFWAFFPLRDETTLSGIVNAPWKINDDRTSLLSGKFNDELLDALAQLVLNSIVHLVKADDPAWILDVLPARLDEARGADRLLNEKINKCAAGKPCIPDQDGALHRPSEIELHPKLIPRSVLDVWASQPSRPANWCHPSVETEKRRARVLRLFDLTKRPERSVSDWLTALMGVGKTPADFCKSIKVAAALFEAVPSYRDAIALSPILIDALGRRVCPQPGRIFIPTEHKIENSNIATVHPKLLNDEDVKKSLVILGIQPVSPELELQSILKSGFARWADRDWDRFWGLVRRCDPARAAEIMIGKKEFPEPDEISQRARICARTLAGSYRMLVHLLLPGPVVPDDGMRDAESTIDTRFHRSELRVLVSMGAAATPCPSRGEALADVFWKYREDCIESYLTNLSTRSTPRNTHLWFKEESFPGPLEPLLELSHEGKAEFTKNLLVADSNFNEWTMIHTSNAEYPPVKFESPTIWAIKRFGRLLTSLGARPVAESVSPTLGAWAAVLPVAQCSELAARHLDLPDTLESIEQTHWTNAVMQSLQLDDDDAIGRFYASAANHLTEPPMIRARNGQQWCNLPPREVTVCSARNEFDALIRIEQPALLVADAAAEILLVEKWKCRPAEGAVRTQLAHIPTGSPVPLIDQLPALHGRLRPEHENLILIPCSEIRQETLTEHGKTSEPKEFWKDGESIYWLEQLGPEGLLHQLNERLVLDLTVQDCDDVVKQREDHERRQLIVAIRKQKTVASKLLKAVGEAAIRPRLPKALIDSVEKIHGKLTQEKLADLARIIYGPSLLKQFRSEMAKLQPPQQWAGGRAAREFVSKLEIPREYAGYEDARRDPILMVDGPAVLPTLHDYQIEITSKISRLLAANAKERRALLSLPTGAGKTRVAVEALVNALRDEQFDGPVLWIAQTDELCEQAVETWRDVWRSVGAQRPLMISRLWAQNGADQPEEDAAHVVVATIQKIGNCLSNAEYDWLSKAGVVVIDEAHGAISPEYTAMLSWLGIDRKGTRCPLIGLTATPFRGRSETETERLANRFGKLRLDPEMGDDPYRRLQDIGVLSQVEHRIIQGIRVELSAAELKHLKEMGGNISPSIIDRIAGNFDRNHTLLKDIANLPRDWPILFFAASVEHAQTMAALLELEGLTAAPISAETEPGARRHSISLFKRGKIQVLTNYNVLTQGFDAPSTRVIYVARPTFSPNLYQQMIGRGLRGPKNGGKETCLIVNVEDNFVQYGDRLAFREFEHLWTRNE
ncbi:MAG: DEAD/DEAH box helicase family protein [Planctomycetota bacterium]